MLEVDELLPDEAILKKIKTKGFRLYFFSFIVAPVSYGIKIIVSKTMSVEEVGLIYAMLGFIGIIAVYNDLGLTEALQYYLPRYILQKDYLKAKGLMILTFLLQAASGLLIGGALFIGADRLAGAYFKSPDAGHLLKFFGLYFIIVNFYQVLQSFYFAVQHVKFEKGIEFSRMVFVLVTAFAFRQFDALTLFNLAVSRFVGLVIATLISVLIFHRRYYKRFLKGKYTITKSDVRQQISYGFRSLIGANARTIIAQIDLQIVIYHLGKQLAGYRTNYMSLSSISTFIFVPLLSFMFPVFTELIEKQQFDKLRDLRKKLLRAILAYGLVLGVVIHFRAIPFAHIVFGESYTFSGQLLQYTAFLLFTPLLGIVNFQYLRGFGKVKWVTFAQLGVLIVHILLSLAVVYFYEDVFLLALILLISHFLFFVVTQRYIRKKKLY